MPKIVTPGVRPRSMLRRTTLVPSVIRFLRRASPKITQRRTGIPGFPRFPGLTWVARISQVTGISRIPRVSRVTDIPRISRLSRRTRVSIPTARVTRPWPATRRSRPTWTPTATTATATTSTPIAPTPPVVPVALPTTASVALPATIALAGSMTAAATARRLPGTTRPGTRRRGMRMPTGTIAARRAAISGTRGRRRCGTRRRRRRTFRLHTRRRSRRRHNARRNALANLVELPQKFLQPVHFPLVRRFLLLGVLNQLQHFLHILKGLLQRVHDPLHLENRLFNRLQRSRPESQSLDSARQSRGRHRRTRLGRCGFTFALTATADLRTLVIIRIPTLIAFHPLATVTAVTAVTTLSTVAAFKSIRTLGTIHALGAIQSLGAVSAITPRFDALRTLQAFGTFRAFHPLLALRTLGTIQAFGTILSFGAVGTFRGFVTITSFAPLGLGTARFDIAFPSAIRESRPVVATTGPIIAARGRRFRGILTPRRRVVAAFRSTFLGLGATSEAFLGFRRKFGLDRSRFDRRGLGSGVTGFRRRLSGRRQIAGHGRCARRRHFHRKAGLIGFNLGLRKPVTRTEGSTSGRTAAHRRAFPGRGAGGGISLRTHADSMGYRRVVLCWRTHRREWAGVGTYVMESFIC